MAKEAGFRVWRKYEQLDETGAEDAEADGRNNKTIQKTEYESHSRRRELQRLFISGKRSGIVSLDEEVVDPDDIEMLEDLISSHNEALRKMEEDSQSKMGKSPEVLERHEADFLSKDG